MNREARANLAQETLRILESGGYLTSFGRQVEIAKSLENAIRKTCLYRPADFPNNPPPLPPQYKGRMQIEVTPESTLEAAQRLALAAPGSKIFCLNFSSAKNPGGGFLSGSQAQEESLARSSGLYHCQLKMPEMYEYNRRLGTSLYSDYMIYSPDVPVFRTDAGDLLDEPYTIAILTVPAVNAFAVQQNEPCYAKDILATMRERAGKLLWVALEHGHDTLVLGAWGCGVFGNEPDSVAEIFAAHLRQNGQYADQFQHVTFAVYDRSVNQATLNSFKKHLGTAKE